jgi:hypothetical protein
MVVSRTWNGWFVRCNSWITENMRTSGKPNISLHAIDRHHGNDMGLSTRGHPSTPAPENVLALTREKKKAKAGSPWDGGDAGPSESPSQPRSSSSKQEEECSPGTSLRCRKLHSPRRIGFRRRTPTRRDGDEQSCPGLIGPRNQDEGHVAGRLGLEPHSIHDKSTDWDGVAVPYRMRRGMDSGPTA